MFILACTTTIIPPGYLHFRSGDVNPSCDINVKGLLTTLDWSEKQIKDNIIEAFDYCDPALMTTDKGRGYGWSHESPIKQLLSAHLNEEQCTEYYNAKRDTLRRDRSLCDGICSLPFLHTTAAVWSDEPDTGCNSWALSCLLHVLKQRLMQLQAESGEDRRGQFMLRLLDLVLERRRASGLDCTQLPGYAVVPMAVMLFDNLAFLVRRYDTDTKEEYFALTTENLSQPIGLADVAQAVLGCSVEQDAQLLAIHNEFEAMWSSALHDRAKKYKHNKPIVDFPFYGWSAVMSIENALFV